MHFTNKRLIGMLFTLVLVAISLPLSTFCAPAVYIVGNSGDEVYEIQTQLNALGYLEAGPTGYYGTATEKAVAAYQTDNGLGADGKAGPATQLALMGKTFESKKGQEDADVAVVSDQPVIVDKMATNEPTTEAPVEKQATEAIVVDNSQSVAAKAQDDIILSSAPVVQQSPVYVDPNLMKIGSRGDSVVKLQNRLKELGYFPNQAVTGYYYAVTASAVSTFQQNNGLTADGIAGSKTLDKIYSNSAVKAPGTGGTGAASSTKGQQTVELARKELGKPYVWGGNGPGSFDCSGLVYYILKQQGYDGWRRNAYMYSQMTSWKSVQRSELVPGDLLFFDTRSDGSTPIGHVGIYSGNGKMIHASTSAGKVVEGSINTDYYTRTYRSAKRVWF